MGRWPHHRQSRRALRRSARLPRKTARRAAFALRKRNGPVTSFVKSRDGLDIAYEINGHGEPVVLIHGFASDRGQNWRAPGWYATLNEAGYRVIALDCRGHGESS